MRQDGYRRDCNERGDETIFDRGRGSLVANEILAFGSNVHSFVSCALPNLRGRLPPLHFPLWTENSNLSLTAAWKSSLVRQVPIATVNETLASLQFRVSRRTAASISPYRFNHELNCERAGVRRRIRPRFAALGLSSLRSDLQLHKDIFMWLCGMEKLARMT